MVELRDNYWAVEVPDGAFDFRIENYEVTDLINGRDMKRIEWDEDLPTRPFVIIPPGTWQIVCTSNATEQQLIELIPEMKVGERYQNYNGDYPVWYHSRKESLRSLLTSKNCDLNKNWLILKKQ